MPQNSEHSRESPAPQARGASDAELLEAVRASVADTYEVLGVMGRAPAEGSGREGGDTLVLLGRERRGAHLVALRVRPAAEGFSVEVARRVDAGDAADASACPRCGAPVVEWGRFCARCGGELPAASPAASREELLDAVRGAAAGAFEILGEMARADGDGVVYFARESATGRIVTLRLRREAGSSDVESYELGETRVMAPLVTRLTGTAPEGQPAAPPPAAESPVSATSDSPGSPAPTLDVPLPPLAQPSPQRATPQEVLLPGGEPAPGEVLPPRPRDSGRRAILLGGAALVVGVLAVLAVVRARESAPDATGGNGAPIATRASAPAAGARPAPDSAAIEIAGVLPRGTRVTVNGQSITGSRIVLPAGSYVLAATAPGYVSVREVLAVAPGQTLAWSPALAPVPRPASPVAAAPRGAASRPAPRREPPRAAAPPARAGVTAPDITCQAAVAAHIWSAAAAQCDREAQAGDAEAALALARLYQQGTGVPRDSARAADWLRRAAGAGSAAAARELGAMYGSGAGVPKDAGQSLAWYRKAALLGDPSAQIAVGKAYERGAGVARDPAEAAAWYTRAAEHGNAWAQNYVGWLYGTGRGVPHDDKEAVAWFAKAAGQGNAQAQYNLGFMYANGRGVAQSDSAALAWYRKSAAQGYADAIRALRDRGLTP